MPFPFKIRNYLGRVISHGVGIILKSSENIQKKEGGPDSTVSNNQFSSLVLNDLAMNARDRAYYNFEFQRGSQSKD